MLQLLTAVSGGHNVLGTLFFFLVGGLVFSWSQAPTSGDLVKVHKANQTEINSITGAEDGMLIYNEDTKQINFFEGSNWVAPSNESKTIVLNRASGGNNNLIVNSTNTYYDFPVNATHELSNTGGIYQTLGNGRIRITETGTYFMSAAFSVRDMPSGNTKYIIGFSSMELYVGILPEDLLLYLIKIGGVLLEPLFIHYKPMTKSDLGM